MIFRILLASTLVGVHHYRFCALIGKCKCIVFVYVNGIQDRMYVSLVNTTTVVGL